MNLKIIIEQEMERTNSEIKSTMKQKGMDTTGKASDSLRVFIKETNTEIKGESLGEDYIYFLDKGRRPGKFPPVDVIEKWVRDKGLNIPPYLVGRKIAQKGTAIFRDNSKGIQLEDKLQDLNKRLTEKITKQIGEDIKINISKFVKNT